MRVCGRLLHKSTHEAAAQFILQPQYNTDNPQNICEGVITNAFQSCSKENSHTDVLWVCQCVVVVR